MKNRMIVCCIAWCLSVTMTMAQGNLIIERTDGQRYLITNNVCFDSINDKAVLAGIPLGYIGNLHRYKSVLAQDEIGSRVTDFQTGKNYAVVLDMTSRNGEKENTGDYSRNIYSAEYMLDLAGMPHFTTSQLVEAIAKARLILLSSRVKNNSFSTDEINLLKAFVEAGGVIISPCINNSSTISIGIKKLFGISAVSYNKTRYRVIWKDSNDAELCYFDEPEEKTFSIGRKKMEGESIKSYAMTLTADAESLATFDTDEVAVARRRLGAGCIYTVGMQWRDIIQRSHLNKDPESQRSYANAFEPSADMIPLLIRAAYVKNNGVSVWKYTVPNGYQTVLVPTHDCDSRTAYEQLHYMSSYEQRLGVKAHYFLTVHYYRDAPYLSAFYDADTSERARQLVRDGHTVGSHSIGHYPDFSTANRFPLTVVTEDEYRATHNTETNMTTGGSTWTEVVLSKQIIERDLGNQVRSFRTGHLCMNKNIPEAQKMGGYSFSSCYSAGDVLSEFPFFERLENSWDGDFSGILQMPLHISDVMKSDPVNEKNWQDKPAVWMTVMNKLKGNYAPTILLIHPNREWKMEMERMLVEQFDRNEIGLYSFEDYGDFWRGRSQFTFDYSVDATAGKVVIRANCNDLAKNLALGFMIEAGDVVLNNVTIIDEKGIVHPANIKQKGIGKYYVSCLSYLNIGQ